MAIEIVVFPIKNGGSFHSYVSLQEGKSLDSLDLFHTAMVTCAVRRQRRFLLLFLGPPGSGKTARPGASLGGW